MTSRFGCMLSAIVCAVLSLAAMSLPTPHDPGTPANCGSLLAGGFAGTLGACEQTRGAYRGVAIVAVVMTVSAVIGGFLRSRRARIGLGVVALIGLGLAADLAAETVFGDPLTYRWVAVPPMTLTVAVAIQIWALIRGAQCTGYLSDPSAPVRATS